jgi:plasmid stability protein
VSGFAPAWPRGSSPPSSRGNVAADWRRSLASKSEEPKSKLEVEVEVEIRTPALLFACPNERVILHVETGVARAAAAIILISSKAEGGDMSQIVVRGIPEADMAALSERARRLGRSREQEVRELIARAADEERGWAEHVRRAEEWRSRLAARAVPDTTRLVREDRERP